MAAKYILAGLAAVFVAAGLTRGRRTLQGRTWLLVGAIFTLVSLWLFLPR